MTKSTTAFVGLDVHKDSIDKGLRAEQPEPRCWELLREAPTFNSSAKPIVNYLY